MRLDDQQRRRLFAIFKEEADEHISAVVARLLALEQASADQDVRALYSDIREELHTIKGSAGTIGLTNVQNLAHELETRVLSLFEAPLDVQRSEVSNVLGALDALAGSIAQATGGQPEHDRVERTSTELEGTAEPAGGRGDAPKEPAPADTIASLPGSVTDTRFVRVQAAALDQILGRADELVELRLRLSPRLDQLSAVVEQLSRVSVALRGSTSSRSPVGGETLQLLRDAQSDLARVTWELGAEAEELASAVSTLRDDLRSTRMLPAGPLLETFRRSVRDLARELGKEAALETRGGEVTLDKKVLDEIKEPLVHLVRNAIAHGIEPPEERLALGKPRAGRVILAAEQRGNRVVIQVEDDGRGIDRDEVEKTARAHGMIDEARSVRRTRDIDELIFLPGLSTAAGTTLVSGRGVGMSVVQRAVARLHGEMEIVSRPGRGVKFILSVPLTIAATRGLLVAAGGRMFAIPVLGIERVLAVPPDTIRDVQGHSVTQVSGQQLELSDLASRLHLGPHKPPDGSALATVVVSAAGRQHGLIVDSVLGEREIVIKDLPPVLSSVEALAGATVLGDGRVVPVLDPGGLVLGPQVDVSLSRSGPQDRVLVVDDSATTRMLIAGELEDAGFSVTLACDGQEALETLEKKGAAAIVADVSMPRMDGLELTRWVRQSDTFARLPVVLVTSNASEEDRTKGEAAGADAYIIKKDFTGDMLLVTLRGLLQSRARPT